MLISHTALLVTWYVLIFSLQAFAISRRPSPIDGGEDQEVRLELNSTRQEPIVPRHAAHTKLTLLTTSSNRYNESCTDADDNDIFASAQPIAHGAQGTATLLSGTAQVHMESNDMGIIIAALAVVLLIIGIGFLIITMSNTDKESRSASSAFTGSYKHLQDENDKEPARHHEKDPTKFSSDDGPIPTRKESLPYEAAAALPFQLNLTSNTFLGFKHTPTETSMSPSQGDLSAKSSHRSHQMEACEGDVLSSALVVHQPGGVQLRVDGFISPFQQEEVIEVSKLEIKKEMVVRIFISEGGKDRGILLESALRFPIAFLDTSAAVSKKGQPPLPALNRRVLIYRASAEMWDPTRHTPFAIVEAADGSNSRFCAYPGANSGEQAGLPLLTVHLGDGARVANIHGADGKLIASSEMSNTSTANNPSRKLQIGHGVDAGFVLCAFLAAVKLM
eukprot:gnl/TRDRNA2_/TRDRNA2_38565_c0_seq1.p1 gnl/TRDRNA2_/TRDRNA2_38565_c0~~gnl/TRDRNA2_/TRDRNA2_38565_c0_seq1.p1  ORF type:complete len:447 (+),score=77.94 gnl/TRDRNA2_/TRDRNA2_38565_c0_seq1:112-1452(+)